MFTVGRNGSTALRLLRAASTTSRPLEAYVWGGNSSSSLRTLVGCLFGKDKRALGRRLPNTPTRLTLPASAGNAWITSASVGFKDYYVLLNDGKVYRGSGSPELTEQLDRLPPVKQVEAGQDFVAFLSAKNEVLIYGQLHGGAGYAYDRKPGMPPGRLLLPGRGKAMHISAGRHHLAALGEDGRVYTVGSNAMGQLGVPDIEKSDEFVATAVNWGPRAARSIAAAYDHTVIVATDGTVWTMGDNRHSQLGPGRAVSDGITTLRTEPEQMVPGRVSATRVWTGKEDTMVLAGEQLRVSGKSTNHEQLVPLTLPDREEIRTAGVAVGFLMALSDSGRIYVWGANEAGYGRLCAKETYPRSYHPYFGPGARLGPARDLFLRNYYAIVLVDAQTRSSN